MKFETTPIQGLLVFHPTCFSDERGWFMESFNQVRFDAALEETGGESVHFVQDNHSFSQRGVLRGLHYQLPPFAQGKLVRVTQGEVWDVAVDIRKGSPTCGQWYGLELSAENKKQFWIPAGFAHGFVALSDSAEFLYKTTALYDKNSERCIRWNDAQLAIEWPLIKGGASQPLVSQKDQEGWSFQQALSE